MRLWDGKHVDRLWLPLRRGQDWNKEQLGVEGWGGGGVVLRELGAVRV